MTSGPDHEIRTINAQCYKELAQDLGPTLDPPAYADG